MKISKVREIAREHGIQPGKAGKPELIRAIQLQEGNFDCFATAFDGRCDQIGCLWHEDCLSQTRGSEVF